MVWEIVFLLVILKIPVVYLCLVVWWAIQAEPEPAEPSALVPVADTPTPPGWSPRPPRRPGPERTSRRGTVPRTAGARAEVRR